MSDPSASEGGDGKHPKPSNGSDKFNELRDILFPERTQLSSLQERLENPEILAENVSKILPESVLRSQARDENLTHALSSTVEKALRISVNKNPRPLVDAIFPVMGPAIRKAISAAITGLIQSLNETLEYSLSLRGLKWRWESIRSGKPFAEVVLLHSLLYRVEQIFLIHRESGLLLQHVSSIASQSADLISGMLTAIQDFVRDSFQVQEAETLDDMRVGELNVWVENGPYALLAIVIRGNAPQELRATLQDVLERIHSEKVIALRDFKGDTALFESIRPYLEDCLFSQYRTQKRKRSILGWIVVAAILIAFVSWVSLVFWKQHRVSRFVERMNQEPGIVVTSAEKRQGVYQINGLRDPLAADPAAWIQETGLDAEEVRFHWEPYHAIHSNFVLARAIVLLNPPSTVTLTLKDGVLIAEGSAKYSWIAESRRLARALPGITRFDEKQLVEIEAEQMYTLKKSIEQHVLRFEIGTTDLLPGQDRDMESLAQDLLDLVSAAEQLRKSLEIEILGHTDTTGDEMGNRHLSQARAESLVDLFSVWGLPPVLFNPVGKASTEPPRREQTEKDREWNRSVTFRVSWTGIEEMR